jgi:hypothetical protein
MMHITVERSGGIMGRTVSLHLDLDEMPADQAETLKRLVDDSDFFYLSDAPKTTSRLDEFNYAITITNKTIRHTMRISDSSAPETLRPLLQELSKYFKANR